MKLSSKFRKRNKAEPSWLLMCNVWDSCAGDPDNIEEIPGGIDSLTASEKRRARVAPNAEGKTVVTASWPKEPKETQETHRKS